MTYRIAIVLGIALFGGIALDAFLTGGATLVFLGKKFMDLLDTVAFWR